MNRLKQALEFEICLCFAHFCSGIRTFKPDKKIKWQNLVSQNTMRRLYFMLKMQNELYLFLFSGFTDPELQSSCRVIISKHIESRCLISQHSLV